MFVSNNATINTLAFYQILRCLFLVPKRWLIVDGSSEESVKYTGAHAYPLIQFGEHGSFNYQVETKRSFWLQNLHGRLPHRSCWRWHLKIPRNESLEAQHGSTQEAIVINDPYWGLYGWIAVFSGYAKWTCFLKRLMTCYSSLHFGPKKLWGWCQQSGEQNPVSWLEMHEKIRWTHPSDFRKTMSHQLQWTDSNINIA